MQKKVVEIMIENNTKSSGTKHKTVKKSNAQAEVENFGIVEINNSSAKARVKSLKDKGYEKTVTAASKKPVKKSLNKVDDYLNFDFRAGKKEQPKLPEEVYEKVIKRTAKNCNKTKTAEEKINSVIAAMGLGLSVLEPEDIKQVENEEIKTYKLEPKEKQILTPAEVEDSFDPKAEEIIATARIGYLFD